MTPKISQNQLSELKETKKMKIIALYDQTPKQFEPDPIPKNSLFVCPKKQKEKIPLNQIRIKAGIEEDIENTCCSAS